MKTKYLWILLLYGFLSCQDPNFGIKNDGVIMIGDNRDSTTHSTITNSTTSTTSTTSTSITTITTTTTSSTTTTTIDINRVRQDIYDELMEYFSTTTSITSTTTTTSTIPNYRSRTFVIGGEAYEQLYIETPMWYHEIEDFVDSLNSRNYGGHNDWFWSQYYSGMPGNFGNSNLFFPDTYDLRNKIGFLRIQDDTTYKLIESYCQANPIILRIVQTDK